MVLHHIPLGRPLLHLPLGAKVSVTLGFLLEDILKHDPTISIAWFLLAHKVYSHYVCYYHK